MTERPFVEEGLGSLRDRVAAVPGFLRDVAVLLGRLVRDERVPRSSRLLAGATVAYVLSPLDVIPDVLPVIGQLDDVWLVARALRRLVRTAGHDVVRELWDGDDEGFGLVLWVAGVDR